MDVDSERGSDCGSERGDNASAESKELCYQLNIYWGIHFPADMAPDVEKALIYGMYNSLAGEDREITYREGSDAAELIMFNYTNDNGSEYCVILVDSMTESSPETDDPDTQLLFEPAELVELEEAKTDVILYMTDIYSCIVKYLRKKKKMAKKLKIGWGAYNCVWEDDGDNE